MHKRVKSLRSLLVAGAVVAITALVIPASAVAAPATVVIGGPTAADWVDAGTDAGITVGLVATPANEAAHPYTTYPAPDEVFDATDRDTIDGRDGDPEYGLGVYNYLISQGGSVSSPPSEIGYYGKPDVCGTTGQPLGTNCADQLAVTLDKELYGGSFEVTFFYGLEQSGETLIAELYRGGVLQDSDTYGPTPATGAYSSTNDGRYEFDLPDVYWDEIRFIGDDANVDDATDFLVEFISGEVATADLDVVKFYDANANGVNDDEPLITGWKVGIQNGIDYIRYTPVSLVLDPDDYTVTEFMPVETNWMSTTTNPVEVTLDRGDEETVEFGNLCLGAGGGLTLGFWSNRNGEALFGADDLTLMKSLNLRNADGTDFDPASYTAFRRWLLSATAENMAYMLSAQLAAMELNVLNGKVSGSALIYAPGTTSANDLGFATVNAVMAEANTELGLHGLVLADSPYRTYQEALKNALDKANNNKTFVQTTPCTFTFAEDS